MNKNLVIGLISFVVVVLIGVGFYFWQQSDKPDDLQIPPEEKTDDLVVDEPQVKVEEDTNELKNDIQVAPEEKNIVDSELIFEGSDFTFFYPSKYKADEKGLWTEEGYKNHIKPYINCYDCQIPWIEIKSVESPRNLEEQIIADFDLPGITLAEMSGNVGIDFSQVKIGVNDFIKIRVIDDVYDITGYYTKNGNSVYGGTILAFRVYFDEKDNQELQNIISTLKFK